MLLLLLIYNDKIIIVKYLFTLLPKLVDPFIKQNMRNILC